MTNRFCLLICCFLFSVSTYAQPWKKAVESSIDAFNKATVAKDEQMLEKLTAEELSYGHSIGVVQNKTTFIKDILSGSMKYLEIDNTGQTISVVADIAIVRNICTIKANKDGAPFTLRIGVLMVWKEVGADWKLLARQGYKL